MSYIQHKAEESLEDYLETILILSKRFSAVRSIDVATELNFFKTQRKRCREKHEKPRIHHRFGGRLSPADRRRQKDGGKSLRTPHPADGLADPPWR